VALAESDHSALQYSQTHYDALVLLTSAGIVQDCKARIDGGGVNSFGSMQFAETVFDGCIAERVSDILHTIAYFWNANGCMYICTH
jgi:hypothetical protein